MNQDAMNVAIQWARAAMALLAPVVVTTFICVPMAIERHPGEAPAARHTTQWRVTYAVAVGHLDV